MFAQTFANHTPITPFIILSSVESTNNYAMAKLHAGMVQHGSCFIAIEQTSGRGQRGKQWLSNPGDNITMSTIFELLHSVSANVTAFPFLLSASMALGCYDFIKDFGVKQVTVKWPNDLYIGDRKAAGILIENIFRGHDWEWTVAGTGVNINQESFPAEAINAISLKMLTGKHYDTVKMGRKLFEFLYNRFGQLRDASTGNIMKEYNSLLYLKGEELKLKKDNIVFTARIEQVSASGELITSGAVEQHFKVGEIEFV